MNIHSTIDLIVLCLKGAPRIQVTSAPTCKYAMNTQRPSTFNWLLQKENSTSLQTPQSTLAK